MKCIECGNGKMQRRKARFPHEIRGLHFEVEGTGLVCSSCGFQMIPSDLISEHAQLVDAEYRRAAGLLSPDEIRAARESLELSQREFAEYLGVGEASVKRWEVGALQDKSNDDLIRLRTDPDYAERNLKEVCRRLGRKSPTEPRSEIVYIAGPAGFRRPTARWQMAGEVLLESTALSVFSPTDIMQ
jgi:putative zinc finger/helix-turn-helix YgiT family protein